MTNFQAQQPSRLAVTPEHLVLALPALAGGLLAAGLALASLLPAWQRNGALEQQRQLLKSQGEALAANRARLGRSREGLQQAEADQRKLLQIVAGTDQLDTLLAQLAVEAAAAGVTLESYEPQAPPAPAPKSKRSKAKGNEAPPSDPLLVDGELVKREQLVMASGAGCSRLKPISASCCRSWRAPISSTPCSRNWRWKRLLLASLLRAMSPRRHRLQRPIPSAAKLKAMRLPPAIRCSLMASWSNASSW